MWLLSGRHDIKIMHILIFKNDFISSQKLFKYKIKRNALGIPRENDIPCKLRSWKTQFYLLIGCNEHSSVAIVCILVSLSSNVHVLKALALQSLC